MNKKFVIGLGSGRCGTVSLADLLHHNGFASSHEDTLMPWVCNYDLCDSVLNKVLKRDNDYVAEVAYYYLPYLSHIINKYPFVKCVCLKRDKEDVIDSFLKKSRYNYWSEPVNRPDTEWDITFPTFHNKSKPDALSLYLEQYYNTLESIMKKFPSNIQLFDMNETLNTEDGQKKLFNFIGINEDRIILGIKKNSNPPYKIRKYI